MTFNKTALFIDGLNLHYTAKALGFEVDFKRLRMEFERQGAILRAYYYSTIAEDTEFTSARPLLDWLDYNGFMVTAKAAKEYDDGEGRRRTKRNIGIELAVDALEIAARLDHMVLFSGDGDFRCLVESIQRCGVSVTIVSSLRTRPAMIADGLRRQADQFLELDDLKSAIGRTLEPVRPIRASGTTAN